MKVGVSIKAGGKRMKVMMRRKFLPALHKFRMVGLVMSFLAAKDRGTFKQFSIGSEVKLFKMIRGTMGGKDGSTVVSGNATELLQRKPSIMQLEGGRCEPE